MSHVPEWPSEADVCVRCAATIARAAEIRTLLDAQATLDARVRELSDELRADVAELHQRDAGADLAFVERFLAAMDLPIDVAR